jgi:hypothetical protein
MKTTILFIAVYFACIPGLSFSQSTWERQQLQSQQAVEVTQATSQTLVSVLARQRQLRESAARHRERNDNFRQAGLDELNRARQKLNEYSQVIMLVHEGIRTTNETEFSSFMEGIDARRKPWNFSFSSDSPKEAQPSTEQKTGQSAVINDSPINFAQGLPPFSISELPPLNTFSDKINTDIFTMPSGDTESVNGQPKVSSAVSEDLWDQLRSFQRENPRASAFRMEPLPSFEEYPKPIRDFIAPPECDPLVRWGGGTESLLGGLEAIGCSVAATTTAPSGVGPWIFGVGVFKGMDHFYTGYKQFLTCELQDTVTYEITELLSGSSNAASVIDKGTDLAPVAYAGSQALGHFFKSARSSKNVPISELSTPKNVTSGTGLKTSTEHLTDYANPRTLKNLEERAFTDGFTKHSETKGGYLRYKHPDGREIFVRPDGEVGYLGRKVQGINGGKLKLYHPRLNGKWEPISGHKTDIFVTRP